MTRKPNSYIMQMISTFSYEAGVSVETRPLGSRENFCRNWYKEMQPLKTASRAYLNWSVRNGGSTYTLPLGSAAKIVTQHHDSWSPSLGCNASQCRNIHCGRFAFVLAGGEQNPGPPKPRQNAAQSGARQPRGTKAEAGRHVANHVQRQVAQFRSTAIYLRGRDKLYPDAAALTRFNNWVNANQGDLDPSEQKVCLLCGHVGFQLCAHSIAPAVVVPAAQGPQIVPPNLRHHSWSFRPYEAVRAAFRWPGFDTHSVSDDRLHGFSNHHMPDDLVDQELFGYLVLNMQPSYMVNGVDDRALRLAHCHRLAMKWVAAKNLETAVSGDLHHNVRIRLTVQRACDNMQNNMLYEQRTPARNFGLAWLPGSRAKQLMLLLLVCVALYNLQTSLGLAIRAWEGLRLVAVIAHSILSFMAATVPDLAPKILVSASSHQSGNGLAFQCVSTDYETRWSIPHGDANAVIQSCSFSDWVMAGLNEVSSDILETSSMAWTNIQEHRDEKCAQLWLENASYQLMWTSHRLTQYIEQGLLGPYDLLRLWFWTMWTYVRLSIYHC